MTEHKSRDHFVSSIKVKGIHLLPPVITQKRRAELQGYKQQAIKLESRLKNCRDLKKNLEDLLNIQPLTDRPHSEISFRSDNHIDALGITDNVNNNSLPLKMSKKVRLSKDIIDVTQYNSDGIKIISSDCSNQDHILSEIEFLCRDKSNTEESGINLTKINSSDCDSSQEKSQSANIHKSPKPRLIRSNSYTLETPSPILLAHLEKNEKDSNDAEKRNIDNIKKISISRNWSSLENNYVPFENSDFSNINTAYKTEFDYLENKDVQSSTPIDKEHNNSPPIKVVQTDISVQKITLNANNDLLNEKLTEKCDTSDSQLLQVLSILPDIYANQIIELIQSQKLKKKLPNSKEEAEIQTNTNISSERIEDHNLSKDSVNFRCDDEANSVFHTNLKNDCRTNLHQDISFFGSEKWQGSTTSISPSQSIYYSIASSDTVRPISNSSARLIDFDCDDTLPSYEKCDTLKKMDLTEFYVHKEVKKKMNVNKKLFPELDMNTVNSIKQKWAASVIGAHVKGYLTRRLLKTERVQSLIETIKDALVCALQLHNAENIEESDVELHRRLINQVSAACFTFHEIFFNVSIQEQMSIIAADRQRKLEKVKRPTSAPSARRSKSSTSPKQKLSSHSRSLTKV